MTIAAGSASAEVPPGTLAEADGKSSVLIAIEAAGRASCQEHQCATAQNALQQMHSGHVWAHIPVCAYKCRRTCTHIHRLQPGIGWSESTGSWQDRMLTNWGDRVSVQPQLHSCKLQALCDLHCPMRRCSKPKKGQKGTSDACRAGCCAMASSRACCTAACLSASLAWKAGACISACLCMTVSTSEQPNL